MALKSILDIEVNDSAFQAYQKSFQQYSNLVKALPASFAQSWQVINKQRQSFNELVAGMIAATYQARQTAAAQREADRLTRTMADNWRDLAKSSRTFASNIIGAVRSLTDFIRPLSIAGGLLGVGGLFGLDRLAASVSGQRRSALGAGIGYGQQASFALNYGRFVDAQGLLGNVAGSLYNATNSGFTALQGAGLSPDFLNTHDAADVAVALLHKLPGLFKGTPRNLIGAKAETLGLNNLLAPEDIYRYLNATPQERSAQDRKYQAGVGPLGLSSSDQLKWQNFLTQLDTAGRTLENVFAKGLANLAKPIGDLSEAFTKAVAAFLGSQTIKDLIDKLAGALQVFAGYVSSPQFLQNLKELAVDIGAFAKSVKNALEWLGVIPTHAQTSVSSHNKALLLSRPQSKGLDLPPQYNPQGDNSAWNAWMAAHGRPTFSNGAPGAANGSALSNGAAINLGIPTKAQRAAFITSYAASIGVDPEVAMRVARGEGFGGKVGDNGTSFGDFQLHYSPSGDAVGDLYTKSTGHHASDQRYAFEQDKFALDRARARGWGDWSSMRGHNPYEGIGVPPGLTVYDKTGGNVNFSSTGLGPGGIGMQ